MIFRKLKDFEVKAAAVTLLSNRVTTLDSSTSTIDVTPPSTPFNDVFAATMTANDDDVGDYGAKLQEAEMLIEKLQQENYRQKQEVRLIKTLNLIERTISGW